MMTHAIEFHCWKSDKPLEVQLEPEALTFIVNPGDTLKFIPMNPPKQFHWAMRVDNNTKAVQLFPEPALSVDDLHVYLNDQLIDPFS